MQELFLELLLLRQIATFLSYLLFQAWCRYATITIPFQQFPVTLKAFQYALLLQLWKIVPKQRAIKGMFP